MQAKLTLRLDKSLIRKAKTYARRSNRSVSSIVANLFEALESGDQTAPPDLSPGVRSLLGALAGKPVSERDHRLYLERKHR